MASVKGTPTVGATPTGTSVTVPTPSGYAVGDVLVAVIGSQESNVNNYSSAGWTSYDGNRQGSTNATATRVQNVLVLVVTQANISSIASSYVFNRSGGSVRNAGVMFILTGVDPAAPVDSVSVWANSSTDNALTIQSVTSSKDNAFLLFVMNGNAGSGVSMLPVTQQNASDLTQIAYTQSPAGTADATTNISRTLVTVWGKTQAAAGASGVKTLRAGPSGGGSYTKGGWAIAFNPKPAATITPTAGVTIWNGTAEVPAQLSANAATGEKVSASFEIAKGSYTLSELRASRRVWKVAHRGGSTSFPEMSAEAYRRCMIYEMPALELSVHRSSDGVFVLHHDPTTTRATGQNYTIATTPWSTLSTLTTLSSKTDNSAQPNEPLARLDAVLPLYADNKVIFIEDKTYNATNRADLLAYIQTFPNYQDHFVWKVDGTTSNNPINPAKAIGLKVWGYYFAGQDLSLFPARAARFDFIGPDYAFSAAEWATAEATGIDMVAHIIATQAQLNTVLSHPIRGVMLANVRELSRTLR